MMMMRVIYPFTAIVGQHRMRRALILNAIDTRIGGVLIRGERGTAKSTAARALAALLPPVKVVKGCRFGCDPEKPITWCTECRERFEADEELPVETRQTPFVNLPVSATEDRVVGTLDIEKAIQKGERQFEPGVLAAANRGLLYIDEVNLLDDHVVDVLLDSAAMGMNIVEREGISFAHPARFILVGTMNPEEGDLRPQLLDRFALSVDIHGILDPRQRVQIMERNLAFESDPETFREKWMPKEQELSKRIAQARKLVDRVRYSNRDLLVIADLTAKMQVDGHRADLVILKASRAHAAFEGREDINPRDIALAAELALPHRVKAGPFRQSEMGVTQLEEHIEQLKGVASQGSSEEREEKASEEEMAQKKKSVSPNLEISSEPPGSEPIEPTRQDVFQDATAHWWEGGKAVKPEDTFEPRRLDTPLDNMVRKHSGRRSQTQTERKRGRYIQSRPANGSAEDLAFDATIRAAAPYQRAREEMREEEDVAFAVRREDYQRKVRVRRASNLILFLVDASWSMAVAERMAATKGAILSLLTDAYQRRDRVGLVVFQKDRASLVLPPTNSVLLAQRALVDIPVGGKTPLSAGLNMAYQVLKRERILHPDILPLLIVLTDGAGNVAMKGGSPQKEAHQMAEKIANEDVRSVVINMEHEAFDQGLAEALADHLDAPCYTLADLRSETLYRAVQNEIQFGPGAGAAKGKTLDK